MEVWMIPVRINRNVMSCILRSGRCGLVHSGSRSVAYTALIRLGKKMG